MLFKSDVARTAIPAAEWFCAQNMVNGRCQVRFPVAFVDVAVQSFPGNSRKYMLGSLRKTLTERIPLIVPGTTSGQLDINLQPTNYNMERIGNGVHRTIGWSTETHKSIKMYYGLWQKFFYLFFIILHYVKCNY